MISRMTFLVLGMTLGAAATAAAQDHPDVAYQKSLLARPLSAADKAICDGKAGAGDTAAQDACRVTRLFLADINAGRDRGFPPMTDIKYAVDKAEKNKIIDRM